MIKLRRDDREVQFHCGFRAGLPRPRGAILTFPSRSILTFPHSAILAFLIFLFCGACQDTLYTALPATLTISYREVGTSAWKQLEPAALTPTIDPNEQRRQDLQTSLAQGWNTWYRASATAHIQLPSAFGFDVSIVDPQQNMTFSKGIVDRCVEDPEDPTGVRCRVRPHAHTFNGSFTHFDWTVRKDMVVEVKSAHTSGGGTVVCLKTNATDAAAVSQLQLAVVARYYFDCEPQLDSGAVPCGNITKSPDGKGLIASPFGLPQMVLRSAHKATCCCLRFFPGLLWQIACDVHASNSSVFVIRKPLSGRLPVVTL